jgi:Transposase domain (DUF772)
MLGPPKVRALDRPVLASLEALVPRDHFYRHLDAQLDLSFVREWARDCYAAIGRPSVDPAVFFRLQLILFFEGLRSERQLMETVALNLAHRWYLGYHLDGPLPDHSSLTCMVWVRRHPGRFPYIAPTPAVRRPWRCGGAPGGAVPAPPPASAAGSPRRGAACPAAL